MRFAKLYNLELHLMTKVEHEKHVKPSLQSLGSASIQPRKSHLKVNVPLLVKNKLQKLPEPLSLPAGESSVAEAR